MAMRLAAIALLMQSATGAICGNWNTTQCEMMNDGGCDCELLAGGTCAKSANCSGVGITNVGETMTTTTMETTGPTGVSAAWAAGMGVPVWLISLLS
mmetsp:Transcript_133818/g.317156  ORF Transcript_133818/g.317156 Transcript_133818/m.317156 type:complete len:97 (+) Transcript_133818:64-354(+)